MRVNPTVERIVVSLRNGGLLEIELTSHAQSRGLIILAHGMLETLSAPRNMALRDKLTAAGFATCLVPLRLNSDWGRGFGGLLKRHSKEHRLQQVVENISSRPRLGHLHIGLFGVGEVGTACLTVASKVPDRVGAVVAANTSPGLILEHLEKIKASTLLVAPSWSKDLTDSVKQHQSYFRCEVEIELLTADVHFAVQTHWGKFFEVTENWFHKHLGAK